MNNNKSKISCKQGFTLIELLVVVLIIGILAAVALPQYKVAVQKSQFVKMRIAAVSIAKSVQTYYLANGDWPSSFEQLDVEPSMHSDENNCVSNSEMYCCILYPRVGWQYGNITCGKPDYTFGFTEVYADHYGNRLEQHLCKEKTGENMCKTVADGKGDLYDGSMWTPDGWKDVQIRQLY